MLQILLLRHLDCISQHTAHDFFPRKRRVIRFVKSEALRDIRFDLITHLVFLVPEDAVPVVFYVVVCAAKDDLRELRPSILFAILHVEEYPVLFDAPVELVEQWVELIDPALTALLS